VINPTCRRRGEEKTSYQGGVLVLMLACGDYLVEKRFNWFSLARFLKRLKGCNSL
jgi:hypothetical protein